MRVDELDHTLHRGVIAARQHLTDLGLVEDSGQRRPDRNGVMQVVWQLSPLGWVVSDYTNCFDVTWEDALQDLADLGLVEDSGQRRPDRNGVMQVVWQLSPLGRVVGDYTNCFDVTFERAGHELTQLGIMEDSGRRRPPRSAGKRGWVVWQLSPRGRLVVEHLERFGLTLKQALVPCGVPVH